MPSIIQELYDGKLFPAENFTPRLEEHVKLNREIIEAEDEFIRQLDVFDPKLKTQFMTFMDAVNRSYPLEASEIFCHGFRLGARMMLDILDKA